MVSAEAIGAFLQEKRISSNIGLEEVSEATGISQGVLDALENNDRDRLPAEVYIRAFYKKYSEYLGLEPEEILSVYQQLSPKKNKSGGRFHFRTVVTLKDKEENLFAGIASKMFIAVIIILGGVFLYWIYKQYLAPYNPFDFF